MNKIIWLILGMIALLLILSGPLQAQDKITTSLLKVRKIVGMKNGRIKVDIGDHATGEEDSGTFYNSTFDNNPGWFVNQSLTVVPQEHYNLLIYNDKQYSKLTKMLLEVFSGDTTNLRNKILGNYIVPAKDIKQGEELKGIW